MPTKEVLTQWEASSPTAKGEGPLQGTTNPAQSLVSAHECFAETPNAEGCSHEYHDGRLAAHQDRVCNNGARTPNSLHADILKQIEAKQDRDTTAHGAQEESKQVANHSKAVDQNYK
ncbi:Ff.00g109440.m01.CDS01 [Fusarium sp. VM40]|nr:Ff.00g109440.m01.CDS01 [Fusarium sp. VM40]